MNQIRQHIRSTQPAVTEPTTESEMIQEDKCNLSMPLSLKQVKYIQTSQLDSQKHLSAVASTS
jgi:hypothetical protein